MSIVFKPKGIVSAPKAIVFKTKAIVITPKRGGFGAKGIVSVTSTRVFEMKNWVFDMNSF
mgnify:FL=1